MTNQAATLSHLVNEVLEYFGFAAISTEGMLYQAISLGLLFGTAFVLWLLFRLLVLIELPIIVKRTKTTWDNHLHESGFFRRLAHLVPGLFLFYCNSTLHLQEHLAYDLTYYFSSLYNIVVSYLLLQSLLTAVEKIYAESSLAERAPITGFIQVGRLLFTLMLVFLIISLLIGQSPIYLLSGLTAIAAVLLLIFRDTILGFVSGIQIAANRMFNTGDWIEMPKYGVDGDIIEIGLTVVKVSNWDKTISTIPTYSLTTEAVKNWRGMSEAGGRRIKRSINVDMRSIRFATEDDVKAWKKFTVLNEYLTNKEKVLAEDRIRIETDKSDIINSRRLTNIGTFRAYAEQYLLHHVDVHKELTCMVRQLKPTEVGLPIEIYCFSKQTQWVMYEHLQADIFDHLLAVLPVFGLNVYQRVSDRSSVPSAIEIKNTNE
ncbi:mechanosensitive ion channel family protein [Glaciecola sp. 1036]|uniref:mechanosensitive ion channel family protein n=1 Tax=Alteromonadaceae TaxID=72275 RepID=UPI003D088E9D